MKDAAENAKKLYSTPILSKYGDLASLTASASKSAKNMDGGNNAIKSN
jgi:hypothetical protein